MAACPSCSQRNPDGARFCNACGATLVPPPAREARKTVTVLFADVTGSTALGERLDPEAFRRVMARYFDAARTCLEGHGGTVEKFIGDAVMAVFGVPTMHEDDALRALRAAAELRDSLVSLNNELERDYGVSLQLRTGVNTGEVVTGTEERLATGDAVNVAARLEQAAQPGEILLGEQTRRLARGAIEVEPVEPLSLKGKAAPLPAHRLLRVVEGAPAFERRLDAPLVGRREELSKVRRAFEAAVSERRCRLVTVFGPPGIGKSRLARELGSALAGEAAVLFGRCLPYGEGITYWPLVEIFREIGAEGELAAALSAGAPEEIFWSVRKAFEQRSRQQPLALVVEDIHWAEPTLLDLIEHLADWTRDAPLLVLCLARPELLDERPGWGGQPITLDPLSDAESDQLIEELLGGSRLEHHTRARIREAAEGNPLFVEQLLAMLAEGGGLEEVPPTIHALLAARLDALPEEERDLLERASVIGLEFEWEALGELAIDRPPGGQLAALVRKELIRLHEAIEDTFRFRHILIRDAAYERIPKETRAALHERYADWLERRAGERMSEYEEFVGYHLEQAHRYLAELGPVDDSGSLLARRAAQLLASAGRRAGGRDDWPAAANLLARADALLSPDDSVRLEVMPDLGEALREIGDFEQALTVLERATVQAAAAGDRRAEWRARAQSASARMHRSGTLEPLKELEEAARAFEDLGDATNVARTLRLVARGYFWLGRFGDAEDAIDRALADVSAPRSLPQEVWFRRLRGEILFSGPEPLGEVIRYYESFREWASEEGSRRGEEHALLQLARAHAMRGNLDQARELLADARAIASDLRLTVDGARDPAVAAGVIEMLAGNPVAAESAFRAGYDALAAMDERGFLSTIAVYLSHALYAQQRIDEAEQFAHISREATPPPADVHPEVFIQAALAKIFASRGEHDRAIRLGREAVERADESDFFIWQADARMDVAEVLRLAARPFDAAAVAEEAFRLYEQKGDVVSARRAREFRDELVVA